MQIQEAILQADQIGGGIVRESLAAYHVGFVIFPTDSYTTGLIVKYDESGQIERTSMSWNPTKSDLLADDWVAVRV